jgi:hypothetical protein
MDINFFTIQINYYKDNLIQAVSWEDMNFMTYHIP